MGEKCRASENGVPCDRDVPEPGGAKGLCRKHYKRWMRHGDFELRYGRKEDEFTGTPLKRCRICGEVQPREEFSVNKMAADGLRGECKGCRNAMQRQQYAADPKLRHQSRVNGRKHRYGLSEADYDQLLSDQGGKCAVCGGPPTAKGFCVDHDHERGLGHARGIVCHPCNLLLGFAKDDPERLRAAIQYLERKEVTHG